MDLRSNRTGVLCQLAFDRIVQADFSIDESGDGLLEVGVALAVGAKTVERGLQISLHFEAPLLKVDFYRLIDQVVHGTPQNLAEVCERCLLGMIEPKCGSFSCRCLYFFQHNDRIALPFIDVNAMK